MKIEWKYLDKGELPTHGKQVRVLRKHGYVGIDNYATDEWVSFDDIICWHELLDVPE